MTLRRSVRWLCGLVVMALAACASPQPAMEETPESTTAPASTATESPASPPTITPSAEPTDEALPPGALDAPSLFARAGTGPIVPHGVLPDHDYTFIGPVVEHDSLTYLFYSSFPEDSGVATNVGYATSGDMRVWQTSGPEPLLSSAEVDFGRQTPFMSVSSALIEDDGSWTLYLNVWEPTRNGDSAIFRATAPAPDGPWTVGEEPVLLPGAEGAWDSGAVFGAYVIRTGDGYRMYYDGHTGGDAPEAIGMATSDDGIVWTKHAEPVLTVESGEAWDSSGMSMPVVQRVGDQWVMLYTSIQPGGERAFGLALSEDGVAWTRYAANPVFTPDDIPEVLFLHSAHLFCEERCWLILEIVQQGSGFSDLWLAEQVGELAP